MYSTSLATEKKKSLDTDTKESIFSNFDKISLDTNAKEIDILELLFNEYDLIEKIKDDKIDNLVILKRFLVDYEAIISAFVTKFKDPRILDGLHKYWEKKRIVIGNLIDGNSELNPYEELETILNYTSDYYNSILNNEIVDMTTKFDLKSDQNVVKESKTSTAKIVESIDGSSEKFSIPKVDELYSKLYDAIDSKDVKQETVYRGRIIRALKKYKKLINSEYENVKCLDEINELLNNDADFSNVIKVLQKEENKIYLDEFSGYLSNKDEFIKKFIKLYENKYVKKKALYKSALGEELKEHGRVLDERFSNEFLEKKGSLSSLVTVLPNAIGLSAKKLGNTINELREAKTNRMKVAKSVQAIKDTGKVILTPAVYMGKFLVSNWYALYSVYKGVNVAKQQHAQEEQTRQEEAERVEAEERTRVERERVNSEISNAIAEEEKRKALAAKNAAEQRARAEELVRQREEAARRQQEAYAQAQEAARQEAERRKMLDAYNKARREQAEAEARYHHEAGTYQPDPEPEPAPDPNTGIVDENGNIVNEYYEIPDYPNMGTMITPHVIIW